MVVHFPMRKNETFGRECQRSLFLTEEEFAALLENLWNQNGGTWYGIFMGRLLTDYLAAGGDVWDWYPADLPGNKKRALERFL